MNESDCGRRGKRAGAANEGENTSVRVTRLDNGLTVATDRMDTVETVSLGAFVNVGTRHEPAEVNGIAHLLEHMAFKGTERRTARDIAEEIEAVGGQLNAFTSREVTAYHAKVLAEDAPLAVDLIADILLRPRFDGEELARERAVIVQEIGQTHDTPDDIIFDHFQETAYPDQALGRPVLGRADIVGRLERANLWDYMRRHYGSERMILSAAGNITHERFVELVQRAFGDIQQASAAEAEAPRYVGGDYREARDLEQVHVILGLPGVGLLDADHYGMAVLSTLLGGGMSSRLFQEVREERGLVYTIFSFHQAASDSGLFGVYAGTGEKEVEELIPIVCDSFGRLVRDASEAELARARAQLKASILMARESTGARCEHLAQQLIVHGRPVPSEEIVAEIEAVDRDMVVRLAERLAAGRPTLAALGPIARVEPYEQLARRFAA